MNFDIAHLLEQWDYQPGQVVVRRFAGRDGVEKIQLRVDLGILQMNATGRPDGKRPLGHPSLFDHYDARLHKYVAEHDGQDKGFVLKVEDCSRLQVEALQYHHRYICLLQLEDYAGVVRDTERNLALFEFVDKHAESEELSWSMQQFKPQLLLVHTRAKASELLRVKDYSAALGQIEAGITRIQNFYRNNSRDDLLEQSGELRYLREWRNEIAKQRPLSKREELERALSDAVSNEDYEKAARMRDAIRNLKATE
jgi:UvrB/uvrC motif